VSARRWSILIPASHHLQARTVAAPEVLGKATGATVVRSASSLRAILDKLAKTSIRRSPPPEPIIGEGHTVIPGPRVGLKFNVKSPSGTRQGQSTRRTYLEVTTGDHPHHASGELRRVERVVDQAKKH
jgi:hypothetical protein